MTQTSENTTRAQQRTIHPGTRRKGLFPTVTTSHLADRALSALWPWRRWEYPGLGRLRGWLMGVSVSTGGTYRKIALPRSAAVTMGGKLRAKARELLALADELDAYAASKPGRAGKARVTVERASVPPPSE